MRTNLGEQRRAFPPGIKSLSEQGRNQILRHGRPGAVDPLTAVVRVFSDNALAPALDTIGLHGDEKNATVVEAVKTRLEKVDERQMDFTQRDGFDFHAQVLKVSRFQSFKTLAPRAASKIQYSTRNTKMHCGIPSRAFVVLRLEVH